MSDCELCVVETDRRGGREGAREAVQEVPRHGLQAHHAHRQTLLHPPHTDAPPRVS